MEYEIISINPSWHFQCSFTHAWLCNIVRYSLGKYWSAHLFRCSKCLHSLFYNIKKLTFFCCMISLPISSDRLSIENLSNYSGRFRFSKSLIFARKLKCFHWQQILSVVFVEVTDAFHPFSRKYPPNTHIWITLVYTSFFFSPSKNGVLWKKKTNRQLRSQHEGARAFVWGDHLWLD